MSRLTTRGVIVGVLGIVLVAVGITLGQPDIYRVGAFALVLTILALLIAMMPLSGLRHDRSVPTESVPFDAQIPVTLSVEGTPRAAGHLLHFEEVVPPYSGQRPRSGIAAGLRPWKREVHYTVHAALRGRHIVGPLLVRSFDPFGLARTDRAFTSMHKLAVRPRMWELNQRIHGVDGHATASDNASRGNAGTDDVLIREYRRGDDTRRVHWRSSARRGQLMVRREEQAYRPGARILLDNRLGAHVGAGPDSTFEWAVSMVASLATSMLAGGSTVAVADASGELTEYAASVPGAREMLLSSMIDVQMIDHSSLSLAASAVTESGRVDAIYAITGALSDTDIHYLVNIPATCAHATIIIVTDSAAASRATGTQGAKGASSQALSGDPAQWASTLSAHGWRVVLAEGKLVPEVWDEVA